MDKKKYLDVCSLRTPEEHEDSLQSSRKTFFQDFFEKSLLCTAIQLCLTLKINRFNLNPECLSGNVWYCFCKTWMCETF